MNDDRCSEIYEEYWKGRFPTDPINITEICTLYYNKGRADAADKLRYGTALFRELLLEELEQRCTDHEEVNKLHDICNTAWDKYLKMLEEYKI